MLSRIVSILKKEGHVLYEQPYRLNIVGLRSRYTLSNSFDDDLLVFWKDDRGKWQLWGAKVTTDPGTYWLKNPMMPKGTAILKSGQYVDCYRIGLHQGKYEALVQYRPVSVLRDYDRNAVLDFKGGREELGLFGINIHRANATGGTGAIDRNSAGCQVFQNAGDFNRFMSLCRAHRDRWGNSFTYTLVDFRDMRRATWRRVATGAGIGAAALAVGYLSYELENAS